MQRAALALPGDQRFYYITPAIVYNSCLLSGRFRQSGDMLLVSADALTKSGLVKHPAQYAFATSILLGTALPRTSAAPVKSDPQKPSSPTPANSTAEEWPSAAFYVLGAGWMDYDDHRGSGGTGSGAKPPPKAEPKAQHAALAASSWKEPAVKKESPRVRLRSPQPSPRNISRPGRR